MQFTKVITVATTHLVSAKQLSTLKVSAGVIHRIDIHFPSGCHGQVHVALFQGGHPIAPSTADMSHTGNAETVSFKEFYELDKSATTLLIYSWADTNTYDHNVIVRVYILPKWVLLPIGAYEGVLKALTSLFGRVR